MDTYFEGEVFKDLTETLPPGEYENCTFENCELNNLSNCTLVDCTFHQCNLSNANMHNTTLNDVHFNTCKIVGVRFDNVNEFIFSVHFTSCNLNLTSFYRRNLQGSQFVSCDLSEVDFADADCTSVMFDQCNLKNAIFENSRLVKTNFHTAENLSLDPEKNFFQKCIFSPISALGLLHKYDIEIRN